MDVESDRTTGRRHRLVVIDRQRQPLEQWLSAEARSAVEVVMRAEAQLIPVDSVRSVTRSADPLHRSGSGRQLIELPLDGPVAALDLALRALARRLTSGSRPGVVVLRVRGGPPPSPAILQRVARAHLVPGVDLTDFQWVSDDGVWVAGHERMTRARHRVAREPESRDLAGLLMGLSVPTVGSPLGGLLEAISSGSDFAGASMWGDILSTLYVEACVAGL